MRTVRFVRDTDPQREGGLGFKSGEVHSFPPRIAQRWVMRSAAVYEADAKADEPGPEQEPEQDQKQQQEQEPELPKQEPDQPKEEANGNTVVSPADDVAGADGAGAGERPEPAAGASSSKPSGGGKPSGGRGGKQHGRSGSKK